MKHVLVASLIVAFAVGTIAAQSSSYGPPPPSYGPPQEEEAYVPQTFRHVYVHVAPDEPADVQQKTIKIPGGDKHVNIIFVKTPSQATSSNTEVVLPDPDEHKNLVYVLLKKSENTNDVKIRKPAAKSPDKPEVYFIRYKGQEGGYDQGPSPVRSPQPTYGVPAARPVRAPSATYGTPF